MLREVFVHPIESRKLCKTERCIPLQALQGRLRVHSSSEWWRPHFQQRLPLLTIQTEGFRHGFGACPCRFLLGFPLVSWFLSCIEPHSCWLLFGFGLLTSSRCLGGVSPIQLGHLTADFLYLWLHLQPGSQVLHGVGSASTSLQNAISKAVPYEARTVSAGHLAEQTINMGTAIKLDFILALKGR